jgi:nitrogen regulatory protein PII 1
MKMIWALIRPESAQKVIDALEGAGIGAMTRVHVTGHGKEMGITAGLIRYTEIPKEMLMIVLADNEVARAVTAIRNAAKTGTKDVPDAGNIGDGKIFVTYVEDAYTIRTADRTPGTVQM